MASPFLFAFRPKESEQAIAGYRSIDGEVGEEREFLFVSGEVTEAIPVTMDRATGERGEPDHLREGTAIVEHQHGVR